jgi:iron complex transport system permease protein
MNWSIENSIQRRNIGIFVALTAFVALIFASLLWNLGWESIANESSADHSLAFDIVRNIRAPRVCAALLCGAALASAGVISQGIFRNLMASPSVLGTESAAICGIAVFTYLFNDALPWFATPLIGTAFAGLATFMLIRWSKSEKVSRQTISYILNGLSIAAVSGALTSLVISLQASEPNGSSAIFSWLLGDLNGKGWDEVTIAAVAIVITLFVAYRQTIKLDVFALGDDVSTSMGVNPKSLTQVCMIVIAVLAGTSMALGGAIAFVGLIVPHATRIYMGANHRSLLLISALNGASLVVAADFVARFVVAPMEIHTGVVASLIGAPLFLFMLRAVSRKGDLA